MVALTTFRRPQQLATGLPQVLKQARQCEHRVEVIVVDNDAIDSARTFVEELSKSVRYVHEPRPGVSAARNAALDAAADADIIVFIDDDAYPQQGWLDAIVDLWISDHPAAVTGSTIFTFESELDARQAREWGEFREIHRPTRFICQSATSRNLLFDLAFMREHRLRFDDGLGLIGGEDTLITRQVVAAGGLILWCEEAQVVEPVPSARVTRRWILRRAYRSGGSWAHSIIKTEGAFTGARTTLRLLVRALTIIAMDCGKALINTAVGHRPAAKKAWRAAASQAGVIARCLGGTGLREYARQTL